jgi:hypothetical protein
MSSSKNRRAWQVGFALVAVILLALWLRGSLSVLA